MLRILGIQKNKWHTTALSRPYRLDDTFHSCANALAAFDKARFSALAPDSGAVAPERWKMGFRYFEIFPVSPAW